MTVATSKHHKNIDLYPGLYFIPGQGYAGNVIKRIGEFGHRAKHRSNSVGSSCREGTCRHMVTYPDDTGWSPATRDRWPDEGPHGGWMLARDHYP